MPFAAMLALLVTPLLYEPMPPIAVVNAVESGGSETTKCERELWDALVSLPNRPAAFDEHAPQIARALFGATRHARDAATLFAVGYFESGFQPRIQEGDCRKHECDRGLARGFFQIHEDTAGQQVWADLLGMDRVGLGASVAARKLRWGRKMCHSESGAISYFAVGTCFGWRGADNRAKFAEKIERKIAACNHRPKK